MGIHIEKAGSNKFILTQTGLISKIIKEAGMMGCNPAKTPCVTTPLGKDDNGSPFWESWEYAVVVGMLMYLATNSCSVIAYSVNQCARFTHCPNI